MGEKVENLLLVKIEAKRKNKIKSPKGALKLKPTPRGFAKGEFIDLYGSACSLQESSLAHPPAIWFGVNDAKPIIMGGEGWQPVPFPEGTSFSTRMHLDQKQVKAILPLLQRFVKTGNLG